MDISIAYHRLQFRENFVKHLICSVVKRLRLFIFLVLVILLLVFSFIKSASLLEVKDSLEQADAILVLGGDSLFWRTIEAVNLYKKGIAKHLIFTGCFRAVGLHNQDNPFVLKRKAVAMGVPSEAILLVTESLDTYGEIMLTRKIIARYHFNKVILVTSPFHQRRAYLLAKKQFRDLRVKILNHPASDPSWSPDGWWKKAKMRRLVFNEYRKILGSWLLGWIGPMPVISASLISCNEYMST